MSMELKAMIHGTQDLNNAELDKLLTETAKEEMDEHLEDLLNSELSREMEEDVFVASLEEGTEMSSKVEEGRRVNLQRSGETMSAGSSQAGHAEAAAPKAKAKAEAATAGDPGDGGPADGAEDDSSSDSEQCDAEMEPVDKDINNPATGSSQRVKKSCIMTPAWRQGSLSALRSLRMQRLEKAGEKEVVELQLGQIKYSQDSIKGAFRDGRSLRTMREQLATGMNGERRFTVNDVPKISVVTRDGVAYSADNRRLWTFKHCGMTNKSRIPVIKKRPDDGFLKKLTTFTSGESIARRGHKDQY